MAEIRPSKTTDCAVVSQRRTVTPPGADAWAGAAPSSAAAKAARMARRSMRTENPSRALGLRHAGVRLGTSPEGPARAAGADGRAGRRAPAGLERGLAHRARVAAGQARAARRGRGARRGREPVGHAQGRV